MTAQTPTITTCDDVNDALAAYALGALDSDEREMAERHLATCVRCRDDLAPLAHVADSLARVPAPVAPPPGLRSRLLTETQAPVQPSPAAPPAIEPVESARSVLVLPRWVIFPVAAAAVLLIAGVAVLAVLLAQTRDDRNDAESAEYQLAAYLSAGGRATKLAEATTDGNYYGHGALVTAPDMPPIVVVGGCSPTEKDREYRVWVARGDDRTRVGVLQVDEDGEGWIKYELSEPLESYDVIGITMVTGDERQDVLVGQVVQTTTAQRFLPR
jgi:anti-sigma-K factor RskA